jgi:hypothetical protein
MSDDKRRVSSELMACRAALADAIKHADDFGAEVDRLRGEKKTRIWYQDIVYQTANALDRLTPRQYRVISGEVGKQTEKLVDKYNALREGIKQECGDEDDYVCVEVGVFRALLNDDEGGGESRDGAGETAKAGQELAPRDNPNRPAPSSDCPNCNGTGALTEGTREQMGCAKCDGRGYTITHQKDRATCEPCRGTGKALSTNVENGSTNESEG